MKNSQDELKKMQEAVEGRVAEEAELLAEAQPEADDGSVESITPEFVEKCFMANEVGDSLLYSHLNRDAYACNDTSEEWLHYVGPHWEVDKMSRRSLAAVERVVEAYMVQLLAPVEAQLADVDMSDKDEKREAAPTVAKRKAIIERINRLRSYTGRNALLKCAATNGDPLFLTPDQLDQNRLLFPCCNGVYDMAEGKFRDGRPGDYLTSCSPYPFHGDDFPCPTFEHFIYEVTGESAENVDCLQRHLGYAATGLRDERMFLVLHGPYGQNGKGTLFAILNKLLGSMAGSIPTEMLMKQKGAKSPSGPSPELMDLKGKRVVWASETESNQSFAHGLVKKFSGGDEVGGRGLNEKHITRFDPTHTLALICNKLPYAPADDDAFWARIRVFRFPFSYRTKDNCTEEYHRAADPHLEEKLLAEAPGIIAWLFRGYQRYLEDGLVLSPDVKKWSLEYRESEDEIQAFIDLHCVVDFDDPSPTNREGASALYRRFKEWWEENHSTRPPSNKKLSDTMVYKGFTKVKASGMFYQYIRLKAVMAEA